MRWGWEGQGATTVGAVVVGRVGTSWGVMARRVAEEGDLAAVLLWHILVFFRRGGGGRGCMLQQGWVGEGNSWARCARLCDQLHYCELTLQGGDSLAGILAGNLQLQLFCQLSCFGSVSKARLPFQSCFISEGQRGGWGSKAGWFKYPAATRG